MLQNLPLLGEIYFNTQLAWCNAIGKRCKCFDCCFPPSIVSIVNDGDIIMGPAFSADISSKCSCVDIGNVLSFLAVGVELDGPSLRELISKYKALDNVPGYSLTMSNSSDMITIHQLLSGYSLCGTDHSDAMVCTTKVYNHQHAIATASFMTDGTPASIAVRTVSVEEFTGPAKLDWLNTALTQILEGPSSSYVLRMQTPGSISSLFSHASPNFISIDRGMLEAGVETFCNHLQRCYSTRVHFQGRILQPDKHTKISNIKY